MPLIACYKQPCEHYILFVIFMFVTVDIITVFEVKSLHFSLKCLNCIDGLTTGLMVKVWLIVFFSRLDCVYGVQSNILMLRLKKKKT